MSGENRFKDHNTFRCGLGADSWRESEYKERDDGQAETQWMEP
jgi:hypothetical protein